MLSIFFGEIDNTKYSDISIYDTSLYFNNTYKDNWIIDEFSKSIIKDIDKSDVIDKNLIKSKALNRNINPTELSGGVKTLLLIRFDNKHIFNASTCGDNCAKWILKIAKDKKIIINLRHIMNFGKEKFKIKILNSDIFVYNMTDLLNEAVKYIHGESI